jgi:hypothetical protein
MIADRLRHKYEKNPMNQRRRVRDELENAGQHSLKRIITGLEKNNRTMIKIKSQWGCVFEMERWPTTLIRSRPTFFRDLGLSMLPLLKNPGFRNLNNENVYIEANIGWSDGYKPKSP